MNYRLLLIVVLSVCLPAEACHTPTRAAELGKRYPDWDFVAMAHRAHMEQPRIKFHFQGRQACVDGQAAGFPCQNVDLVGFLDLDNFFGGSGSDSWGWKHEASERYFALMGLSHGTAFVDITTPDTPVFVAYLPSSAGTSVWRDIKVYEDHAFIVADMAGDHGMQVFDLSRLLAMTGPVRTVEADTVFRFRVPGSIDNFRDAHNIVINQETGYAYAVGSNLCNGGLVAINIQQPTSPVFEGCYLEDGYTHDAQCIIYRGPDLIHRGKEICFASNEDTLTIVDVSNKASPQLISKGSYPGFGYTHQGWLTPDERYFLMDDETDELAFGHNTRTYVFDLEDLDAPRFTGYFQADGSSIDHNQYVVGNHTFQANYSRGLRILELGDLSSAEMTEVAWFDTFPEGDNNRSFSGAWNVYPFFDNGMVLISDINRGVFILQPQLGTEETFMINQGMTGAWFNPETPGQGVLIDLDPDTQFMFVSWFVFDRVTDGTISSQRWLTLQGSYQDGVAQLSVFNTTGGRFNDATRPTTVQVGTATLSFDSCGSAVLNYQLDSDQLTGEIDLQPLLPSTQALCEQLHAAATSSAHQTR